MSSSGDNLVYLRWNTENVLYHMTICADYVEFSLDNHPLTSSPSLLTKYPQHLQLQWKYIVGCQCMHLKSGTPSHSAFLSLYTYLPDFKGSPNPPTSSPSTDGAPHYYLKRKVYTLVFFDGDKADENLLAAKELQSIFLDYINHENNDQRPYLALINPKSGSGNAHKYFKHIVNRIFSEASIGYELVLTEYSGHARDIIKNLDYHLYRGIVVVSGDGLVHEVLNGLADRSDWLLASRACPIGVVAGGSGNGLAASVAYGSGYLWKSAEELVMINSLLLVSPRLQAMDVVVTEYEKTSKPPLSQAAIRHLSTERRMSFLSLTWGLLANVDIDSEPLRFLGELRFTVAAVAKIIKLAHYPATLQYLPIDEIKEGLTKHPFSSNIDVPVLREPKETSSKLPESKSAVPLRCRDSSLSVFNPVTMATSAHAWPRYQLEEESAQNSARMDVTAGEDDDDYPVLEDETSSPSCSTVKAQSGDHQDNSNNVDPGSGIASYSWRYLAPLKEALSEDAMNGEWISETGEFVTICAVYQSHLSEANILDSTMRFDSGYILLVLVRRGVTRKALLSFLSDFEGSVKRKNDFIQVVKVKAFRLVPLGSSSHRTRVSLDGEEITSGTIQCELLPQAAQLVSGKLALPHE